MAGYLARARMRERNHRLLTGRTPIVMKNAHDGPVATSLAAAQLVHRHPKLMHMASNWTGNRRGERTADWGCTQHDAREPGKRTRAAALWHA